MKWGGYRSPTAKKKAIIVVAHPMLIIWHILATGTLYDDPGATYFTRRLDPERTCPEPMRTDEISAAGQSAYKQHQPRSGVCKVFGVTSFSVVTCVPR